jgi:hypothetical protein
MGVLTDFFIATPEDVHDLRRVQRLRDLFPTLEMNNVDSIKVEILAQLVVGNFQELKLKEIRPHFLAFVKGASAETFLSADECSEEELMNIELWIDRFDPVFVERLATFPAEHVLLVATQWARQWAAFEGRPVRKEDAERLSVVMQQLCQFATRARTEGKHLYLQTCL